jgi:hypothetical protein
MSQKSSEPVLHHTGSPLSPLTHLGGMSSLVFPLRLPFKRGMLKEFYACHCSTVTQGTTEATTERRRRVLHPWGPRPLRSWHGGLPPSPTHRRPGDIRVRLHSATRVNGGSRGQLSVSGRARGLAMTDARFWTFRWSPGWCSVWCAT